MYIVSLAGDVLISFDKWDIRSVARAELWIRHHHYYIFKYECVQGTTYITVRSW